MARDWDAERYDALDLPHEQWGRRTLARLHLDGHEHVLDAGCGTGRDTRALLDTLPRGHVTALDASASMLAQLRTRLADRMDRIDTVHADLGRPLPLDDQVDAIFSVAAFHWVTDHDALFRNLAAVLRPGGTLVSDSGGHGNVSTVTAAVADVLGTRDIQSSSSGGWTFPTAAETEDRLREAGFTDLTVELRPHPFRIDTTDALHRFFATVILGGFLDEMAEADRPGFVDAVTSRLPEPAVDFVRLEITATRARP